jgi:putative peptide zinc metalloprotease protein
MWHVLEDPATNSYFRLSEPAYRFVAMLDGRRTVAQAWATCNDRLGDAAPTQGEAIQLLGQLYTSNLLQADLPPDAEGLLKRYRQRRIREIQGYVTNLLFVRIPLIDPDHFLNRWVGVFGRVFSWYGLAFWIVLLAAGIYSVAGRTAELADAAANILDPAALPLFYLSLVVAKVFHEFGHAFAVKRFGRQAGQGGEVHVMGVMFLVFMPLPYVDASSAWAFRGKWRRVVVGAAGMMVELAIAAVAAVLWANTSPGTLRSICYNVMFVASVSSLLFNGNPLLRYDAYYILSDLLEIPNLAHRSRQYLYYLVRRYVWRVKRIINPANSPGERGWFVFYGLASTAYRFFIFAVILLFLSKRLPRQLSFVAMAFAAVAAFTWICVPLAKFVRYLATSGELARVRGRAVASTLLVAAALLAVVGAMPAPDRVRVEGVVEPQNMAFVYAGEDGFVVRALPSGTDVRPEGAPLVRMTSRQLAAEVATIEASLKRLRRQKAIEFAQGDMAAVRRTEGRIAALRSERERYQKRLASLDVHAPLPGTWVAPRADRIAGAFLHRNDEVGLVADLDDVMIRAVVGQDDKRLIDAAGRRVQLRVRGRPTEWLTGTRTETLPAGRKQLPSAALGYAAGGPIRTDPTDPRGARTAERVFQVLVRPDLAPHVRLLPGQRVVVRFDMSPKPLAVQWWRYLRQLILRRIQRA